MKGKTMNPEATWPDVMGQRLSPCRLPAAWNAYQVCATASPLVPIFPP